MNTEIKKISKSYFLWKYLNLSLIELDPSNRLVNIPESISESFACELLGMIRNNGNNSTGSHDAIDHQGKKVQIKASSLELGNDLSSFGPRSKFDYLLFVHFDIKQDLIKIFKLFYSSDSDFFKNIKVNLEETVADQQVAGRRPRFSIYNCFGLQNVEPIIIYKITEFNNEIH